MFITLSLVAVLIAPILSFSYPVFGTKRYHRAVNANKGLLPVYSAPYYDEPVLAPSFPRYPSDTSNYYYLPRRESQYYGLPTYRGEYKPTQYYYAHSPSYYDDRSDQANPLDDLHEEMLHEDQRDRLRDYSIGQETWYENPAAARQDKLTNVFLKNLIAYNQQQMNQEPELDDGQNGEFDEYSDGNDAEYFDQPSNNNLNIRKYSSHQQQQQQQQHQNSFKENEDKDVMDLNSLAGHSYNKEPISQSNYPDYQQDFSNTYEEEEQEPEYDDDTWINWSSKRSASNADHPIGLATFSDRKPSTEQHLHKPIVTVPTTKQATSKPTSAETTTTAQHIDNSKGVKTGQKEIVLPRPATPVRTPFSEPLMEMLTHNSIHDKRQAPADSKTKSPTTVYDTIRQLLAMEQNLDKTATETKVQKRFVSNEESLVHQLNGLRQTKKV